jgi:hypothetical protein
MREIAYYIPIITLLFSIFFATKLWKHYKEKPGAIYILWWFIGVMTYAVGTFTESYHALFGWSALNFKSWYISGALLGGAPLAQGTVYLVMKKIYADRLTIALISVVCIAAICVALSPIKTEAVEVNRLIGSMLVWQWTRAFSPFINLYALIFLVGGAAYSAWKYAKEGNRKARFLGNVYIAIGALLPGIGGTFTRMGYEEVLFVTELVGVLFIYTGYTIMKNDATESVHKVQKSVA